MQSVINVDRASPIQRVLSYLLVREDKRLLEGEL